MSKDDAEVKIGISLDSSKLPGQVKRAEDEIKGAVERATEAIEAQGAAAEETAEQLDAASSKAAALQRSEAAGIKQLVGESQRVQKQLANETREGMRQLGQQVSSSMKGAAAEITATMKQAAVASVATGQQVSVSMKGAAGAAGGLTTALKMAKGAMDVLSRGFAIIGLFNQVVATVKMVMEWWQELQKETISAGQKVANQWKMAREEAENTARMRAPHESLREQIALNDRLLEQQRERNAFDAEMAQMKAEREGNRRGVQQAILDGQLARGEISSRQHLEGYRKLEDAEREEAQELRMQQVTTARDAAQAKYDAQVEEHRTASENLVNGVRGAILAGVVNQGGAERREYWEWLATRWADLNELVGKGPATSMLNNAYENAQANRDYERVVRERAALGDEILGGARFMGVKTEVSGDDGKMVRRDLAQVAAEVMSAWDKKRAELRGEVETQMQEEEDARVKLAEAQARVDELSRAHEQDDRGILQRRAQEDATLAHRAEAEADKAEATAEAARVEQQRREERNRIQERKAAEESELQTAQELLTHALQMLKERASEDQKPAVAALEALLARAEQEPEVSSQIAALLNGDKLSMTDDQSRRYGNEMRLVGSGGLDKDAMLEVLQLLGQVEYRQGNVQEYGNQLEDMDRRDAEAAESARRQRVLDQEEVARRARRHAESEAEAAARSRAASGATPLEGVDGALSAGTDAMNAQGAVGDAAVAAMGAFHSTATALASTAAEQAGQISVLHQGQIGLQQQISNINRNNIC